MKSDESPDVLARKDFLMSENVVLDHPFKELVETWRRRGESVTQIGAAAYEHCADEWEAARRAWRDKQLNRSPLMDFESILDDLDSLASAADSWGGGVSAQAVRDDVAALRAWRRPHEREEQEELQSLQQDELHALREENAALRDNNAAIKRMFDEARQQLTVGWRENPDGLGKLIARAGVYWDDDKTSLYAQLEAASILEALAGLRR